MTDQQKIQLVDNLLQQATSNPIVERLQATEGRATVEKDFEIHRYLVPEGHNYWISVSYAPSEDRYLPHIRKV